ncbi:RNA polymerase sigma factor [Streptomyces sp. 4N509B]|uniref:RNA polymerase sigma factor n=1 Tax=Streptomyces sp. 4N509B TaxID=3457413 RepID=UPI003FCF57AC
MEASLNQRVRTGELDAFDEIYDAHVRVVFAHALRSTGDRHQAEDVVSLTFLEAWRLREKLRGEVLSVRAWLLGIATNVLRNRARSARRHRDALARLAPGEAVPDIADEVVGRLADGEQLAAAVRALAQLRRREREVFTLCVWSGLSYAETAAALGVPVGTVRSRLSRARARLETLTRDELRRSRTPRPAAERTVATRTEPLTAEGHISSSRDHAAPTRKGQTR